MSKRKQKQPEIVYTEEALIEREMKNFLSFHNQLPENYPSPPPLRQFEEGEDVLVGNLLNCVIFKKLWGGKAFIVRCDWIPDRDVKEPPFPYEFSVCWWTSIRKKNASKTDEIFSYKSKWAHFSNQGVDSLLHYAEHNGLVCDPQYQRSYVWTDEDKESYLDTLFEQGDIGKFVFLRNAGYNYKDSNIEKEYILLDGSTIKIPMKDNYYIELIDGQQRATTLWRFFKDFLPYRGLYYSELSPKDQINLKKCQCMIATIEREEITDKEILELFLKVNRGVPQSPEHIKSIKEKLEKGK